MSIKITRSRWEALWALSVLAVFFGMLMEWLFFFTKPSFLSTYTIFESLHLLIGAPSVFILICTLVIILCWIICRLINQCGFEILCISLARIVPAFFLGAIFFLLLDNFTYTLLRFGTKTAHGMGRFLYAGIFLFFFGYAYRLFFWMERHLIKSSWRRKVSWTCLFLAVFSIFGISPNLDFSRFRSLNDMGYASNSKMRPNILLIGSDGLSADDMSVYGYERQTTPFISEFTKGKALFCENAFTNAANSAGSIASMLTGKYPTQIKLYYPPEILRGRNAFEHLPGILRRYGYKSIDISVRQFADAYDLNMRNSFDVANDRKSSDKRTDGWVNALLGQDVAYFITITSERFISRLLYVFGQRDNVDSFDVVTGKQKMTSFGDGERINKFISFISSNSGPFFAHIHLLGTHGPTFHPRKWVFAEGKEQKKSWMRDFYDDAILDFDSYFKEIIQYLKEHDKLNNTIVIIYTDHGMRFSTGVRMPLIFMFPGSTHVRRIKTNVQNLDIAPTLLEFLNISKPDWMKGQSVLFSDPERHRPIISAEVNGDCVKSGVWMVDESKVGPPFYSLGSITVTICDRNFSVDLRDPKLLLSTIKWHTDPCMDYDTPTLSDISDIIIDHLAQNGYDVTSLKLKQ